MPSVTFYIVVGTASALVIGYYLLPMMFGSSKPEVDNRPPPEKMERLPVGLLTVDEIAQYRGQNGTRILVSICGRVFDLTKARDFYGVDGPYHCFTGADASFMLGAMSLNFEDRNKKDFVQDGDHQITLSDWIARYRSKYPIVGRLEGYLSVCPESWREAGADDHPQIAHFSAIETQEILLKDFKKAGVKNHWVSVNGIVFNVSSAFMVYDEYYGDFANSVGNDITFAVAKNDFKESNFNIGVRNNGLSDEEFQRIHDLLQAFRETYSIVGHLQFDISAKYEIPADCNTNNASNGANQIQKNGNISTSENSVQNNECNSEE